MKNKAVIGILAHVDAGKTTLSESLLYKTGVIAKAGRVDYGDSFLDGDTLERERGITIYSKNARIPLNEKEIILIDTPGHADFSAETERVLSVLDAAVLVIDASSGITSHTRMLWALLKYYEIPVYIFVNKTDIPGFDKTKVLNSIKNFCPEAVDFTDDSSEAFFENIATCKEEYLNFFLEKSNIEKDEIVKGIKQREIFPVFSGSALKLEGIDIFLNGLDKYMVTSDSEGLENEELCAVCYKIVHDSDSKRLTFAKIISGTLAIKDMLGEEKVNEIRIYSGEKYKKVTEVKAGEICAIAGLNDTNIGTVFGEYKKSRKPILTPVLSYAIDFGPDADLRKMWGIVSKYAEEDPSLNAEFDEESREIKVSLMGDVQTQVFTRKFLDDYGIKISFREGKIRYKETIEETVIGVGHFEPLRHYAEAQIKITPLERGSGVEFDSELSEDFLDKNWQKSILSHLKEKEHKGVLIGAPLTDVRYTLVAGRAHPKHTEGGDFRQASYRAVRQGAMKARELGKCRILEPYYDYTLDIPESYVGRAVTDITAFKGTAVISEKDYETGTVTITGRAPVSAMNAYTKEIVAYSKGRGKLIFSISGYDYCHNEEEFLENTAYNPDSDLRNLSSSVFCSHGAGTVVEWQDVDKYKHTEYSEEYGATAALIDDAAKEANRLRREREANKDSFISPEEVDGIIQSSAYANQNGRKTAYKGISEAMRRRNDKKEAPKEVVYKGTDQKEKYLLVDAYNVIHAWSELDSLSKSSMDAAADRLNEIMSNYREITEVEIIVVYDAYRVAGKQTSEKKYDNITVVYTKEAQTADQYIERYAHQNSKKYDITVATSDGLEQIIVTGAGCNIISSREFEEEVKRKNSDFNERFGVLK